MQIHFKYTHLHEHEISPKVTNVAQRKLTGLKKYLRDGTDEITQVYVELGMDSEAHQQGKIWHAHINLDRAGERYHASVTAESIEVAIDQAVSEIERDLQKHKKQRKNVIRKGGGAIKAILRGFK